MANFSDDFNRGITNTVGNGWSELEAAPGRLVIDGDYLFFTASSGDEGICYRARSGGPARNNTTVTYRVKFFTTVGSNNWFSVSGSGANRTNLAGTTDRRLHITITSTQVKVYDGTTLKASANHGLTLIAGTYYYVRWDIESDYSMRVYIKSTSSAYTYADIKLFVSAFTPTSVDGGNWEIGGGGSAADIAYDDLLIYDTVQASPSATPTVNTNSVSSIGLRSVIGNGEVVLDEGYSIIERGFCWDTNINPTTSSNKIVISGTIGVFSGSITGLSVNTDYYIRAYAINSHGTSYGSEVMFSTLNIANTNLVKDINGIDGSTYAVRMHVGGTVGTVSVALGTTGESSVFTAGGGYQVMQGIYGGSDGLIITHSVDFNGTIDDVMWVRVEGVGIIDWTKTSYTTVLRIASEVFFKRIEDDLFDSYRLYRYLDLLFKDLDGYVTVTIREEKNDGVVTKEKTFSVGNTTSPASPFSKRKISFLCKDQAIIIGLSNASLNETFAIAKFVLSGHKRPKKMFKADRIVSVG